jgi:hypothetical protein
MRRRQRNDSMQARYRFVQSSIVCFVNNLVPQILGKFKRFDKGDVKVLVDSKRYIP